MMEETRINDQPKEFIQTFNLPNNRCLKLAEKVKNISLQTEEAAAHNRNLVIEILTKNEQQIRLHKIFHLQLKIQIKVYK